MSKQEVFTKASYEYMNMVKEISDACELLNKPKKNLLYGFDVVLQLSLMHLLLIDKRVSPEEIEFLSKIIYENDLMKILNEKKYLKINLTWEKLAELSTMEGFTGLLYGIYSLFKGEVSKFILLFVDLDTNTIDDHMNSLKNTLWNISKLFLEVDGLTEEENNKAYTILKDYIFDDMDEIKGYVYKKVNKKEKN